MTTEVVKSDETTAAEKWLDQLDPGDAAARDGKYLRHVTEAAEAAAVADAELRAAVLRAREAGETWAMIGMMLGITRQGAYQRFGQKEEGPS